MQSWYTSRHSKDGTCFWDWQSRYRARQSFMHCDCLAVCAASIIDPRCKSTGLCSQAPTEVTAKVPIIAPSATMPIFNLDTFTPRGVRGHISIAAFVRGSHLCSAVPCSDNRQVKSASSRKSCGRSGLMNLFAMRYWRSRSVARVSGGATHGGRRYIRGRLIRARMRRGLWGPGCALIHDPHRLEAQRG
jgi:hypothetical protein